jgi:hypothetical protein
VFTLLPSFLFLPIKHLYSHSTPKDSIRLGMTLLCARSSFVQNNPSHPGITPKRCRAHVMGPWLIVVCADVSVTLRESEYCYLKSTRIPYIRCSDSVYLSSIRNSSPYKLMGGLDCVRPKLYGNTRFRSREIHTKFMSSSSSSI